MGYCTSIKFNLELAISLFNGLFNTDFFLLKAFKSVYWLKSYGKIQLGSAMLYKFWFKLTGDEISVLNGTEIFKLTGADI